MSLGCRNLLPKCLANPHVLLLVVSSGRWSRRRRRLGGRGRPGPKQRQWLTGLLRTIILDDIEEQLVPLAQMSRVDESLPKVLVVDDEPMNIFAL